MKGKIGGIMLRVALLLIIGATIGTALLTLAYMVPVNFEKKQNSYETLEEEGWYPEASSIGLGSDMARYFKPDVLDNSSDYVMLSTALDTSEGNPLMRAMNSYSTFNGNYSYYWHGYIILLRPLLFLIELSDLRILNGACQLILLLLLAFVVGKEKGIRYVFALMTSFLMLGMIAMPLSLQFSWVFYIAYGGTLILLKKQKFFRANSRYVYFFAVIGMITSYFDLLTYPLLTWGMPLLWWIMLDKIHDEEKGWLKRVVYSGISWIVGYAGMWVMKWTLATVVLRRNIFESAISEVFLRSGMGEGEIYSLINRMNAIYLNWKHYGYWIYAILLVGWLLWWIYQALKNGWHRSEKRFAYFLIGISSVVWYFTLANHTQAHFYFTYRIFGVSVLAFMAIVLDSIPDAATGVFINPKRVMSAVGVWGVIAAISLPLTLCVREDILAINGWAQFCKVLMNDKLEMDFTPTYNKIKNFCIGLECAGTEGKYYISILDGADIRYQEIIDIADWNRGYFQSLNVSWKFDEYKKYRLSIEAIDNNEPAYVWVTETGEEPLNEYRDLFVDDVNVEGQILSGITYWWRPGSKWLLMFVEMTWIGILTVTMYVFSPTKFKANILFRD